MPQVLLPMMAKNEEIVAWLPLW